MWGREHQTDKGNDRVEEITYRSTHREGRSLDGDGIKNMKLFIGSGNRKHTAGRKRLEEV